MCRWLNNPLVLGFHFFLESLTYIVYVKHETEKHWLGLHRGVNKLDVTATNGDMWEDW